MLNRLLMIDSGAFSSWTKGVVIDLKEYIRFCMKYHRASYYVNLDVIPGVFRDKNPLSKQDLEDSCNRGWNNYQKMIKYLPFEKVIPVYHQGESIEWLEKYLKFGTPYLGISPANDRTTDEKLEWMGKIKKYLFDTQNKPVVKTHGFAVTSYRLMKFWQWHSVDSASWVQTGGLGSFYLPRRGVDYANSPIVMGASPRSPNMMKEGSHVCNLSPTAKEIVINYLKSVGSGLGTYEIVKVPEKHKREVGVELWYDRKKGLIVRKIESGVTSCHIERKRINALFVQKSAEYLPVDHIYFAGDMFVKNDAGTVQTETTLTKRLLSYFYILNDAYTFKLQYKLLKQEMLAAI